MTDNLPIIMAAVTGCAVLGLIGLILWRAPGWGEPQAAAMAEIARQQIDTAARLDALMGLLTHSHSQLQRTVNERLDSVSHRIGDSMAKTTQHTTENLQKLNERLPGIHSPQKNTPA